MKPINSQKESPAVKPVRMKLIDCRGCLTLTAVNESDQPIAHIFRFWVNETVSEPGAKDRLEARDYDTSFAQWDEHGCIVPKRLRK